MLPLIPTMRLSSMSYRVAVESDYDIYGTPYPHYKAAARLTYSGGSWSVTQLYGYDYCDESVQGHESMFPLFLPDTRPA